jgi:hypothetical protein
MNTAASFVAASSAESCNLSWQPPTGRQVGLFLSAALLALFCRLPRLLLEGRVYAEEGTTYLRYAWNATFFRAFIAPHQGYYSLLDNVCALIAARLLPLSTTALFFAWTAAAIQLLLIYLTLECEAFRTSLERWLALFALLLVTPNVEAWLVLESCQSILAVAAAVIVVSSAQRLFALRAATLALGALTSVTTVPLIPLFWIRVWRERSRGALAFALCITLPSIIQSAVLLHAVRAGDRPIATHELRALAAYASSRMIVLPFTTGRGAQYYDAYLFHHPGAPWIFALYVICLALLVLGFLFFRQASGAALWLYFAALLSSTFDWYGCPSCTYPLLLQSLGGEGRYFFSANSMLLLALALAATRNSRRSLSYTAAVMFGWLMVTGAVHYFRMRPYLNRYPAWLPQVRRWQTDETTPIILAPDSWRANPLRLTHQHPNRTDLPADAYDSFTRRPALD